MQQVSSQWRSEHENGSATMNGHRATANDGDDAAYSSNGRTLSPFDQDIVRLIGQYLKFLGLRRTAEQLVNESHCQFEHPAATKLRTNILHGDFDKALIDLNELRLLIDSPENVLTLKSLLLEQKYFELLEAGRSVDALFCLRREITPLLSNSQPSAISGNDTTVNATATATAAAAATACATKARELSLALMLPTADEVRLLAGWITIDQLGKSSSFDLSAVRRSLLEKISSYLPIHVMVPEQRLQVLLRQAVEWQSDQCVLHNSDLPVDSVSLLSDHTCTREHFPSRTLQVLHEHSDEVWLVRFSPDGMRLASGSKDGTVNICDVNAETQRVVLRRTLELQPVHPVQHLAWSPNSQYLLICGPEENGEVWVYEAATGERKGRVAQATDDNLTCAAWFPDSKRFVCGGQRGQFYCCELDGSVTDQWDGVRVVYLACAPDNRTVIAADTQFRLRAYVFSSTDSREYTLCTEDHPILSFTLDDTGRYALVHVQQQGVHLWDLQYRTLVRKFRGVMQRTYTLQGSWAPSDTIGGRRQQFIASGSEDGRIAVFHVHRDEPVLFLEGHTRSVGSVHWNPRIPAMLASASDDGTVRIWGPDRFASRKQASLTTALSEQQTDSDDEPSTKSKSAMHVTTQL